MPDWPESVERVASYLRLAHTDARLEEFPQGTPTAREAADAVGCRLEQIVKSLVFVVGDSAVVALVPGDRRVNPDRIGVGARVADADEVRAWTDFEPGAVAPFPLPRIRRVLMDRSLLGNAVVWIGAGSPRHMAAIGPTELMRLARAQPGDIAAES
jgi:prolyl-tRNA editing enzyme YbaK/EbsC (Cys-tRNA(Pro) deacylase)